MPEHAKLYKTDTKGKTRVWWLESNETGYRTHSGIKDGKIVTSGWKFMEQKNVGKANETSIADQIASEVAALYEKQQYQGKYHGSIDATDDGAKFLEAMLAHKFDPKKHFAYKFISQPKLDGVRCLATEYDLTSRGGKPFLSSPHILEALKYTFSMEPEIIAWDGELYNHDLKADFEKIISLARKAKPTREDLIESNELIEYHIYDVITKTPMTYPERKALIERVLEGDHGQLPRNIMIVPSVEVMGLEQIQTKLGEYLEAGYEGQMLRDPAAFYEHKRSKSLLKDKTFEDEEAEIVEILEGVGNWAGYAKAVIIRHKKTGIVQQSGMRGTQAFAKKLLEEKAEYVGGDATVRFQNKTSDGKYRFPVVTAFYKGKRDL